MSHANYYTLGHSFCPANAIVERPLLGNTTDGFGSIVLKNSPSLSFDFVQGVVAPLADRRSSIVGRSERSIFLPDRA